MLEMKCNQLSKPEAREPRKQNSIDDRMEKKELGRNKAQSGGLSDCVKDSSGLVPMAI